MKIILAAIESGLAAAWERHCKGLPNVTVYLGSILNLHVDAVVSPANSFGFMDGGIDEVYRNFFKKYDIEERFRMELGNRRDGELLVGEAKHMFTGHHQIPAIILAPTMRVPMRLPKDTVNPYLATRAALLKAAGKKKASIAFPGMGTGVGHVAPDLCAKQMRQAIVDVCSGEYKPPETWVEASRRHQMLYGIKVRDLQEGLSQ